MECSTCSRWVTERKTVYEDGSEVMTFQAPKDMGMCGYLLIQTGAGFGCNAYVARHDSSNAIVEHKSGAPWHHWIMVSCPDCAGAGNSGDSGCHRCAGTGKVRQYDDGYVGEERTRMHPREREAGPAKPKCAACSREVEPEWAACPYCGGKLDAARATEVIKDDLSIS